MFVQPDCRLQWKTVDKGRTVKIIYLDFRKAFDIFFHSDLRAEEMWTSCMDTRFVGKNCWTVGLEGFYSMVWSTAGSQLRVCSFNQYWGGMSNTFISNPMDARKGTLSNLMDDTKWRKQLTHWRTRLAFKGTQNLEKSDRWKVMKLNKGKHKVLHLGWNNLTQQQRLGTGWISALRKIFWRIMVDKLSMNQQIIIAAMKANHI